MFERLTDRARKVMALANEAAQLFGHQELRAEHILHGLAREGSGVGATVLKDLGLDLRRVRMEVEKRVKQGVDAPPVGKVPQGGSAQSVIENAIEESQNLNHNYVGSEHLMLGLVRDEGIAGQVLADLGVTIERARERFVELLGGTCDLPGPQRAKAAPVIRADCPMCQLIGRVRSEPSFIAEMQTTYALLGSNQGCRGWCVLVLREHREHLGELPMSTQGRVFQDVARMAGAIRRMFPQSGRGGGPPRINYECLGNLVQHTHWHVIPRHADDPEPTKAVWGWSADRLRGTMSDSERGELVRKLRETLNEPGAR